MMGWKGWALVLAALLGAGCSADRAASEASALEYFKRGNQAYQREDYRHAIRMYRQASTQDPRSPVIQYNLGLACYQAQIYAEAAQAYRRAIQLDPTFAEAHRNLALAEDRLYNLEAAQTHYTTYQAMVRAQQEQQDKAAAQAEATAGKPAGAAPAAETQKPSRQAPKKTAASAKDGAPASVSELRRIGGDGKPNESSPKPGGESKWWTQDSSSRNR